jgi:hypothetical protein
MAGRLATAALVLGLLGTVLGATAAQVASPASLQPATNEILDLFDRYLPRYEQQLSTLVADEDFQQQIDHASHNLRARRRLLSDVAFLRLPGQQDWLAHRSVREVDGRPVGTGRLRLTDLLAQARADDLQRARAIVEESSALNLGNPRTINVPTLPLELLHASHRHLFDITVDGEQQEDGRRLARLLFRERSPGAIVRSTQGDYVRAGVLAWIDIDTGELLKADATLNPSTESGRATRVRVEFRYDPALKLLVPARMEEWFPAAAGNGRGEARYSNFRRFTTGARVVPQ